MWLTGDLVTINPQYYKVVGSYTRMGIVIAVVQANNTTSNFNQNVYYVYFHDGKFEGPLFQKELLGV